jgi:hypothetical protein
VYYLRTGSIRERLESPGAKRQNKDPMGRSPLGHQRIGCGPRAETRSR